MLKRCLGFLTDRAERRQGVFISFGMVFAEGVGHGTGSLGFSNGHMRSKTEERSIFRHVIVL